MRHLQGIESKFRFILVAAKRAHQLRDGSRARVESESNKVTVVAQREVSSGLVPFEINPAQANQHEQSEDSWRVPRDVEFTLLGAFGKLPPHGPR